MQQELRAVPLAQQAEQVPRVLEVLQEMLGVQQPQAGLQADQGGLLDQVAAVLPGPLGLEGGLGHSDLSP